MTQALRPTLGLRGAGWPSLSAHLCSTFLPSNGLPPWQEGCCWELGRPLFQVLAPGRRALRLLIGVKWEHQTLISSLMEPGAWGSAGPCIPLLPKPSWTLPVGRGAGGCRLSQSFWEEECWPVTSPCHPGRHSSGGSVPLTAPGDQPSVASSWQEATLEQVWKERTLASEDLAHILPGVPKA